MTAKPPKTREAATALLERYAQVEGQLVAIDERRARFLARSNALADAKAAPLVAELAAIAAQIERWWAADGKALLPKGRKSMALGGCSIGSSASAAKLEHGFADDDKAVAALQAEKLAGKTTRTKVFLDKGRISALLKATGKTCDRLKALGFSLKPGTDTFFIGRVKQGGTIGS